MKILVMANYDVGLYRFRKELLEELLGGGNEVVISLPDGEYIPALKEMGCRFIDTPVDRRGINPLTDIKLFFKYIKMLKAEKPDMVITYTIKPNVYGAAACRLLGIPYSVNITGLGTALQGDGLLKKLILAMYGFSLKKAKNVFFENQSNRDALVSFGVVPEGADYVNPGAGVNIEDFVPLAYPEREQVRFLFVGRLMKEKGVDELLYAAEKLKGELGDAVAFDVVGFYEDDEKERVEEFIRKGIVDFHGFQRDVVPFYKNASAVVLPSWHEGMSNVILEAGASARPVITNDIPGCRESVTDGVSGLLCKAGDGDDLLEKLGAMAKMTAAQRAEMGRQARLNIESGFDKKIVVKKTAERLFNR